jgi:hypothetical protein
MASIKKKIIVDASGKSHTVKVGSKADIRLSSEGGVASPYQRDLAYSEPKSPVSVISSAQGKTILDAEVPRHEADIVRMTNAERIAAGHKYDTNTGKALVEEDPRATFINETGQEAIFNQKQLDDPKNQKFLQDGGYFMRETQGPSFDPEQSRSESDIAKRAKEDLSEVESSFSKQENLLDAASINALNSIKSIYEARAKAKQDVVARQLAQTTTEGIRSGGSRYAGEINQGILNAEERAGLAALDDIAVEHASAIAEAEQALLESKFDLFKQKRDEIKTIEERRRTEMTKLKEVALAERKAQRENMAQASRDSAVADLMSQGVTDPAKILEYLNFNEQGKQIGEFTAKEVKEAMKNLADENAGGDIDKLSGDIRDFYILQREHPEAIPAHIASLPPEQQLGAWMKFMTPAKVPGVGAVNKITLTEASSRGLPLSTVGLSEEEVAQSFNSATPPQWFVEKANKEAMQSLQPIQVQGLWDGYRLGYDGNKEKAPVQSTYEKAAGNNQEKAKSYFKGAYGDAIDDATADTLAEYVQLYIDGGKSYEEAINQVIEEAS